MLRALLARLTAWLLAAGDKFLADLHDVWGDDDDPDTAYEPADPFRHDYTGGGR